MKRVLIFLLLMLASTSWAKELSYVVNGDTLTINYATSDFGDDTNPATLQWPASIDHFIGLANQGKYAFCVEAQSDTTGWRWIRQTLQGTSAGAGVDLKKVNRVEDFGANDVRASNGVRFLIWKGLVTKFVFKEHKAGKRVFIKIYPTPLPQSDTQIVERIVEKPAASNNSLSNFQMPKLPKFGLAAHLGAMSTIDGNVAPMATLTLRIDGSLVQVYGFQSLFFPREEDFLEKNSDVYDQGVGFLAGKQLSQKIWLIAGYQRQEIVLDDQSDQSGRNISWFQGGEGGLMLRGDDYFVTLTGLYGHKKVWSQTWDQTLETDMGARLAVGIRFKGGK